MQHSLRQEGSNRQPQHRHLPDKSINETLGKTRMLILGTGEDKSKNTFGRKSQASLQWASIKAAKAKEKDHKLGPSLCTTQCSQTKTRTKEISRGSKLGTHC